MESATGHRRQARSGQVLSITALVGVLVIALGVVTIVLVYLNRVTSTVESLDRTEPLGGYAGRPAKAAAAPGAAAPVDYLLMVAGEDDTLLSVHLLRLSGDRQHLTMIGIPSDLVPYDPGQPPRSLAASWLQGRDAVAKQVELLFGVPTDHQITVGLSGLSDVVSALGGLGGIAGQRQDGDDGRALLRYVADAPDGPGRVERVSEVAQILIQRLGMMHAMTNPGQFDQVLKAIERCTLVDSNLTAPEFESTLMETGVQAEEVGLITVTTVSGADGRTALPAPLANLRRAMAADTLYQLARPIVVATSPSPTAAR